MMLLKGLLLGSVMALASAPEGHAADSPAATVEAPIDYVRVCDAYGAGFFFVPGTDTCLKIGGLALSEVQSFNAGYSVAPIGATGMISGKGGTSNPWIYSNPVRNGGGSTAWGYIPTVAQYSNARSRDDAGWDALGRVELDARTGTPWGTLRAFFRMDAFVGTGAGNVGSWSTASSFAANPYNAGAGNSVTRATTVINKAFIQFAGLTAGRAQSMFDFYANAYNFQRIAGSSATTQLLAYTHTFGDGFSGTISLEDENAREAQIGSTVASTSYAGGSIQNIRVGGVSGTSFAGAPSGTAWPDIVGNVRVDQPWGSVQVSAAGHEARGSLYATSASPASASYASPAASANAYGWAAQTGVQLNADYLSPGDKLWLQAAYEKGAVSYIWGDNLSSSYGAVSSNRFTGSGYSPSDGGAGWNANLYDCIFTLSGICEQQSGFSVTGAYKHYWLPTLASAFFGSFAAINYSNNALAGFGGAVGAANLTNTRVGANLVWTPIKGFDVGAEFMYVNVSQSRPAGLAPDSVLNSVGLPGFKGSENEYEGRVRVQRAF
ncbi:Porin [Methylocella tundrae]|uniref:Porin n=1 Tax=Methylocella tundrae TaxID=227605 RepID=A0A8B6M4G5_METTU|nr:porin [Methylocella tundrae]VTZ27441.1 Porin [Methylocella tundrae]VTZ49714.1 Porin [Methylocella tundrae]